MGRHDLHTTVGDGPGEKGHYLLNEFGLAVVEAVARPVNPTRFTIHAAVHAAGPDVECVIHLHSPWGVALSMILEGLLPVSQWAMRLNGRMGWHAYEGLALGAQEQQRLVANLDDLDGLDRDGDAEWPALLRRVERLSPGYRD